MHAYATKPEVRSAAHGVSRREALRDDSGQPASPPRSQRRRWRPSLGAGSSCKVVSGPKASKACSGRRGGTRLLTNLAPVVCSGREAAGVKTPCMRLPRANPKRQRQRPESTTMTLPNTSVAVGGGGGFGGRGSRGSSAAAGESSRQAKHLWSWQGAFSRSMRLGTATARRERGRKPAGEAASWAVANLPLARRRSTLHRAAAGGGGAAGKAGGCRPKHRRAIIGPLGGRGGGADSVYHASRGHQK